MVNFLLHNEQMTSMRDKGIKERPPSFFVHTDKFIIKFFNDHNFICLAFLPLLKYVSDMSVLNVSTPRIHVGGA